LFRIKSLKKFRVVRVDGSFNKTKNYIFYYDVIHGMTVSETLKKNWIYIALFIIVIIPLMYVIVSFVMMVNEPSYALF